MRFRVAAHSVLVVLLAGCAEDETLGGGGASMKEIKVDDDAFEPSSASAQAGDTFKFENEGSRDHTVTVHRPPSAPSMYIKDTILRPGQDTTLTFDQAGTYHVFCRYHGEIGARMHLNVTVTSA